MPLFDFQITDEDIRALETVDRLTFDSKRSEILKSLETIDVQACPGSGKTTLIAAKLILLSQKWLYHYRGVCVLSHTNVAKDEIINKIKKSNVAGARKLLSYPHFIGTIQDFIDTFLALPLLRSSNIDCRLVDNAEYHEEVMKVSWPQAIFNDINDEVPNESYNEKSRLDMSFVIDKSHRFDVSIGDKIKGFSFNEIDLDTDLSVSDIEERKKCQSESESFMHSVFIYRDETIGDVIPEFAKLFASQFSEKRQHDSNFSIKAIGAVGKELDTSKTNELKIASYWTGFDKSKSKKNFRANHLIEAVYFTREQKEGDWLNNYRYLTECILRLLRVSKLTDDKDKYFTATSLKETLISKKLWGRYRRVLFWFTNDENEITSDKWQKVCNLFKRILEIDISIDEVSSYLEFKDRPTQENSENRTISNAPNIEGIKVELSTIHGVKGETHDATLVLETKNYNHDIYAMLPYLTGNRPDSTNPNNSLKHNPTNVQNVKKMPNQKFMRQLYVAMSRPKHLLCFAIHQDRISCDQRKKLAELGWNICVI